MNRTGIAKGMTEFLSKNRRKPMTMSDAERAYLALVDVIQGNLVRHGKIRLPGIGTFILTTRKGPRIKNFEQQEVSIPDYPIIKFKSVEGLPNTLMNIRMENEEDLSIPPNLDLDSR